jgi:ZIP family zinc transporter
LSFGETVLLGALAGFTIYLGLPFGRLQLLGSRARVGLAMFAVGVLAFLFVDVFEHAFGIVEHAVGDVKAGRASAGRAIGLTALLGVGFAAGSAGLAMVERHIRRRNPAPSARGPCASG